MLYMLEALSGSAQSKCLGLEPKWHCHFGIPRQHRRLYHVSTLMVGRLWGFVGVDNLKPEHTTEERKGATKIEQKNTTRMSSQKGLMKAQTNRNMES